MIQPRRRAAGLASGAGILFLVGTNVQAGWVLAIAALLLGVAFAGVVLPPLMIRRLDLARRAPAEATAGDEVTVELVVRNRARSPRLSLLLDDRFVARARLFVPVLLPRGEIVLRSVRGPARRGVSEDVPVRVSSSAPFGVSEARRDLAAGGRTLVLPRSVRIRRLAILERPARPGDALHTEPRRGHGGDFLGVREYRVGDSLRHVHWPSSARHGTLIVREFEREEAVRLAVLVDTWGDSSAEDPETALDVACAAAASAVRSALSEGATVAVALGRSGRVDSHAPVAESRALHALAEARAPGGVPLDRLADSVSDTGAGDAAFAAIPTWAAAAEAVERGARILAARGTRLQVVLVDAATFARDGERPLDADGVATLAAALRRAGALVGTVGRGDDLAPVLEGAGAATR